LDQRQGEGKRRRDEEGERGEKGESRGHNETNKEEKRADNTTMRGHG